MHIHRQSRLSALLAAAILFTLSSHAPARSAQASASACADMSAVNEKNFAPFLDAMITPGKRMNVAELLKSMPPDMMAKLAALQKTEAEQKAKDWPNLCRYQTENAAVAASGVRPKVIFLGDSITENWKRGDPSLFGPATLDRGISGQTTPQILLRFYQDVVALRPRVVHIMAGTNDISGNTGPTSDAAIVNNIRAMIDIAKTNGIRIVLASITPSKGFSMRPGFDPSPRIAAVNRDLVRLAAERHITLVDYFPPLANSEGGLKDALGNDGLHPNRDGYAIMRPLAEAAIARASR
jgi:lysophospholipase L1-like esterase